MKGKPVKLEADSIDACRNGDEDAFREIVEHYQPTLSAQMSRFSRDRNVVANSVHDLFVEAFMSLGSFKGKSPLEHWLRKIAVRARAVACGAADTFATRSARVDTFVLGRPFRRRADLSKQIDGVPIDVTDRVLSTLASYDSVGLAVDQTPLILGGILLALVVLTMATAAQARENDTDQPFGPSPEVIAAWENGEGHLLLGPPGWVIEMRDANSQ